jgi:hypothetical protein
MFKRWMAGLAVLFLLWIGSGKALAQAPIQLSQIRKIYIEKMDNNLDQYLASEISQKFHGSLTVVLERSQADAILKGVNITAQNTTRSTVDLVDPAGRTVLWSGSAGDKSWMTLEMKHGGQEKIAAHIVGQLKKAMQR